MITSTGADEEVTYPESSEDALLAIKAKRSSAQPSARRFPEESPPGSKHVIPLKQDWPTTNDPIAID